MIPIQTEIARRKKKAFELLEWKSIEKSYT